MNPDLALKRTFWLGAHKTGTTYLQGILAQSLEQLADNGVGYELLEPFRNRFTRPVVYGNYVGPAAPSDTLTKGSRQSLIFDENIIGLVQDAISVRGFYPNALTRLERLTEYLGFEPDEIVFGLRSQDTFIPSIYCQTLRSLPHKSFRSFLGPRKLNLSWANILKKFQQRYPRALIKVYLSEDLPGSELKLLSELLDIPRSVFGPPMQNRENKGFSQATVETLDSLAETQNVVRSDIIATNRRYPKGPDHPAFYPWTAEEAKKLKWNYQQDIEIVKTMKSVAFLSL